MENKREREREKKAIRSSPCLPAFCCCGLRFVAKKPSTFSFPTEESLFSRLFFFVISRRLLFKMAASLSYRSGGSVGSTVARSAGRGAAARAPIAARPASSSTSAAVVAAAASLRRGASSNGASCPWALPRLSRFSPLMATKALSRACWVETLAFEGSVRARIGTER